MPPEEIAEAIRAQGGPEVHLAPDPPSALALARDLTPPSGLICVTGSLFLAAETRAHVLRREPRPAALL